MVHELEDNGKFAPLRRSSDASSINVNSMSRMVMASRPSRGGQRDVLGKLRHNPAPAMLRQQSQRASRPSVWVQVEPPGKRKD